MNKTDMKEYGIWIGIRTRCYTQTATHYEYYGGKGIEVCDRWLNSFENFLADMGPMPTPEHTIDRIDSKGNYCPANCRWATRQEQSRNTSSNRVIELKGEKHCLAEWAEITGISETTIKGRIDELGWDVEKALTEPPSQQPITVNGETGTIFELAKAKGLNPFTVWGRIKRWGWTPERAMTEPAKQKEHYITAFGQTHTITEWSKITGIKYPTLQNRLNAYGWEPEKALSTPVKMPKPQSMSMSNQTGHC